MGKILLITLASFIVLGTIFIFKPFQSSTSQKAPDQSHDTSASSTRDSFPRLSLPDSSAPPLLLKSIGVNLNYYDPKTNKAGDFEFTKQKLQFDRLFMPYGFVISGNISSTGKDKANPQPTFILPMGTKVRSLIDGTVVGMPKVWSGDYSIQVSATDKMETWLYETEHVINPVVKVGDRVKAGQPMAEVSDFDQGTPKGFGAVEIGILKGGNPPQHVCPLAYLDESIKDEIFRKMNAFFKSWEDYVGDQTLYSETSVPGCLTLDPIQG